MFAIARRLFTLVTPKTETPLPKVYEDIAKKYPEIKQFIDEFLLILDRKCSLNSKLLLIADSTLDVKEENLHRARSFLIGVALNKSLPFEDRLIAMAFFKDMHDEKALKEIAIASDEEPTIRQGACMFLGGFSASPQTVKFLDYLNNSSTTITGFDSRGIYFNSRPIIQAAKARIEARINKEKDRSPYLTYYLRNGSK